MGAVLNFLDCETRAHPAGRGTNLSLEELSIKSMKLIVFC